MICCCTSLRSFTNADISDISALYFETSISKLKARHRIIGIVVCHHLAELILLGLEVGADGVRHATYGEIRSAHSRTSRLSLSSGTQKDKGCRTCKSSRNRGRRPADFDMITGRPNREPYPRRCKLRQQHRAVEQPFRDWRKVVDRNQVQLSPIDAEGNKFVEHLVCGFCPYEGSRVKLRLRSR